MSSRLWSPLPAPASVPHPLLSGMPCAPLLAGGGLTSTAELLTHSYRALDDPGPPLPGQMGKQQAAGPTLFSTFGSSINHGGPYARGHVASPTLRHHSWSHLASLHAGSLPILSGFQQEASTCRSQEFCGHPLGLLQVGLSLTKQPDK